MEVDTHVSSPPSSPVSPPYFPISSRCSSSSQEFGETVLDQSSPTILPVLLSHGMDTKSLVVTSTRTLSYKTKQWRGKHALSTTSIPHNRLNLSVCSDDPPDIDVYTPTHSCGRSDKGLLLLPKDLPMQRTPS